MTGSEDDVTRRGDDFFVSYARHGEDVVLWRALGTRPDVFYVDVGASHPEQDSVTKALYLRGWRGINVEPRPERLQAFLDERPGDTNLALAMGDQDGPGTAAGPAGSGVDVCRLSTLFADQRLDRVDVLRIGDDVAVARGLLDGPVRPTVCIVDGRAPGTDRPDSSGAVGLLVAAGYVHCMFDGLNHYLTTDASLAPALSTPANPSDRYVTWLTHRLLTERAGLRTALAELATENLALRDEARSVRPDADGAHDADAPVDARRRPSVVQRPGVAGPDVPGDWGQEQAGQVDEPPAPPSPTLSPVRFAGDPAVRRARRAVLIGRLLAGRSSVVAPLRAPEPDGPFDLLEGARPDEIVVDVLYQAFLGRAADPGGRAVWARRIEGGEHPLALATEMTRTAEMRERSRADRLAADATLTRWSMAVVAEQLGLRPDVVTDPTSRTAHVVFVTALFEVAYERAPRADELLLELSKLAEGIGRNWLLRDFGRRQVVADRFLGSAPAGPRQRLRRVLDRRSMQQSFRREVENAEHRYRSLLLQNASSVRLEMLRTPPAERG